MNAMKSSTNNLEDPFNEDNTFFNSIDFDCLAIPGTNTKKIPKSQKFGVLSLKGGSEKENSKRLSKPVPITSCKKSKVSDDFIFGDTFDQSSVSKVLCDVNASTSRTTHSSSNNQTPKEYDAFASYLCDITQSTQNPSSNTPQANQFKKPKTPFKRTLTDKLKDAFNESSIEDLEHFFDEIEHSISRLEANFEPKDKNEKISQVIDLICSGAQNIQPNLRTGVPDANINWADESLQNLSGFECSFATSFRKILIANANKEISVVSSTQVALAGNESDNKVDFTPLGPFYGLPNKVKELMKFYKGFSELYDWQKECLALPAIESRKNLIYALPTSGGKTLVAEILMLREVLCYKRNAIFVLPFVAIVQEKVWALAPFGVSLGFLVEEYAASKGTYPPKRRRRKNSIFICTIEKALGLVNSLIEADRMQEVGAVIVDELHLVGERGRGATLETLLTKLMVYREEKKADIQVVGMSATIGNVGDICRFLDADLYTKNFRPVELVEYLKCEDTVAKINWGKDEEELVTVDRTCSFRYTPEHAILDPDQIGGLVMEVIPKDSCLIFCATKKNCENVSYLLCKVLKKTLIEHKKEDRTRLRQALKQETHQICKILNISLQYGVAYHHSGLTNEERRLIEDAFRAGTISVICCTSTLAAGVNLPARRVILRQPYVGRDFISLARYKQMVGRAGRAGLGEVGESILMCAPKDLPKVKQLLQSPMDRAVSDLANDEGKGLRQLLLSAISLGLANTRVELHALTRKTLLFLQAEQLEVNVKKLVDRLISELFKLGALEEADLTKPESVVKNDVTIRLETTLGMSLSLVEECEEAANIGKQKRKIVIKNNTKLVISKLGCAAIRGGFDLSRAHLLYDDLAQAQRSLVLVDSLHLLYLITPYDMATQVKPNKTDYFNIYCKLSTKELQTARVLGLTESVAVRLLSNKPINDVPERVLNRFYLTLMLYDLWNEKSVYEVSEKFQVNRGVTQNLMLASSTFASNVVNFCDGLEEFWSFAQLLRGMGQRLSYCCVKELMPLMELPSVKESRAKQLFNAGYKNLQSIAKANENDLVESIEFLPRKVAKQLIATARMLLLEKIENLREDAKEVCEGLDNFNDFL